MRTYPFKYTSNSSFRGPKEKYPENASDNWPLLHALSCDVTTSKKACLYLELLFNITVHVII